MVVNGSGEAVVTTAATRPRRRTTTTTTTMQGGGMLVRLINQMIYMMINLCQDNFPTSPHPLIFPLFNSFNMVRLK